MALGQRRMLYSNIWQNRDIGKLSDKAQRLYIGTITVADDDGRLRANSLLLRSQIFPYNNEITQDDIRKWVGEMRNVNKKDRLIDFYRVNGEYYIQHPHWHKYQSIRKDLYKPSDLPSNPLRKNTESVPKSHPKLNQVKLSKDKQIELAQDYLLKIPEADLDIFYKRFDCSKKAIVSKGEQLFNYCKMHEKFYKDYRAFLLNAIKGDFPERKAEARKPIPEILNDEPETARTPIPKDIQESIKQIFNNTKTNV